MKLAKLFKDEGSKTGHCPSVYLADSGEFVVQGYELDADTSARLEDVLPGEAAVRISPEIVIGAIERYERLKHS